MPSNYPDNILPYPLVQYIPLRVRTRDFTTNWANNYNQRLFIFDNQKQAQERLAMYNISYPDNLNLSNRLLLLFLNGQVKEIFYRAYNAQTIVEVIEGSYHLFTIPKQYFYRDTIIFNLFLAEGTKVLSERYQLS
ncbi:hypothetical protein MWH28_06610 [Natroniella sulfidigena]|uniref:hypothetical protein n=1 Tax=Natroniella sulfidigena TaxID=723921 RepID=UPI00200A0C54|nr:hypothetical protein [Natroniella sulfidigena]MCK8817043.1 hypothetical protein [Natroniella sulfidigena]